MRKIEIADSNPLWKDYFKAEKKKVKAILGKNCVAVHHIGSTAVRGLNAQPIIDIMLVVKEFSIADEHNAEFEALGYECKDESKIPGCRFYTKDEDKNSFYIYIFEENNKTDVERYLAVRDYLENHPNISREYANLKTKLAEEFSMDHEAYHNGKGEFLQNLEEDAIKWKKRQDNMAKGMAMGMCLGVSVGCAFGVMFGNLVMGTCYGMCIGMLIGLARGSFKERQDR